MKWLTREEQEKELETFLDTVTYPLDKDIRKRLKISDEDIDRRINLLEMGGYSAHDNPVVQCVKPSRTHHKNELCLSCKLARLRVVPIPDLRPKMPYREAFKKIKRMYPPKFKEELYEGILYHGIKCGDYETGGVWGRDELEDNDKHPKRFIKLMLLVSFYNRLLREKCHEWNIEWVPKRPEEPVV